MTPAEDKGRGASDSPSYDPKGRGFYGAVTVSERGQVVIPAKARRDLDIHAGDKLLVLGDPQHGIALLKLESLMQSGFSPPGGHLQQGHGQSQEADDKE
ncbi:MULTISPECIES: AbrB/MazE/SpoVT family DNA-binding domain-containing protein [unclassified Streptomyces]|uniref:AbrB/MazE/SpoVT family DNA-binding domain-containing protein n=1 Tax=unclassified Streptomyces TaxID=2593676 RepID=UPI0037ADAF88